MRAGSDCVLLVVALLLGTVVNSYQQPPQTDVQAKYFAHYVVDTDTLILKRKLFVYRDELFTAWSEWSKCSTNDCAEIRYRRCLNESFEERIVNLVQTNSCPFQFVAETRRCRNDSECHKGGPSEMLQHQADTCGVKPLSLEIEKPTSTKILGGREATPHSWPWQVALYVNPGGRGSPSMTPESPFCGATLIAPLWLITAAHCLSELVPIKDLPIGLLFPVEEEVELTIRAQLGDHTRGHPDGSHETTRLVVKAIIHPGYRRGYSEHGFDVALLRMDEPVTFGDKIGAICVPDKTLKLPEGHRCFASGWGENSAGTPAEVIDYFSSITSPQGFFSYPFGLRQGPIFGSPSLSTRKRRIPRQPLKLLEVDLRLVSLAKCRRTFRNLREWVHVCAGEKGKDTCRGDSGGGLFCQDPVNARWYLYGVTSFGSGRGCGKHYGVYTCARGISEWVHHNVH